MPEEGCQNQKDLLEDDIDIFMNQLSWTHLQYPQTLPA